MKPFYQDEAVTILHGDCFDLLPTFDAGVFDLVLTDPPYGVGYAEWDGDIPRLEWLTMSRTIAPVVMLTPGNGSQYRYPPPDWTLSWSRPGSIQRAANGGFSHWEPVLVYGKNPMQVDCKVFPASTNSVGIDHPCPKPEKVWSWLISDGCPIGGSLLDPFMGSGTSLRVAKDLGRKAIGIEIEERYCEIAAKRMAQRTLFEAEGFAPAREAAHLRCDEHGNYWADSKNEPCPDCAVTP